MAVVGILKQLTHFTCAVVKKRTGYEQLTKNDIVACVADRLPEHKQLHGGVYFVDESPTTPNGKVLKRSLTALVEQEYGK